MVRGLSAADAFLERVSKKFQSGDQDQGQDSTGNVDINTDIHNLTENQKKEFRQQYLQLEFPNVFGISLGEFKCIRSCRMCPMYNLPPENNTFITDEIMERALNTVGERSLHLEISAFGETFQHPKADDYMFLSRRLCPNSEILFVSTGDMLNRERCEKIVDSGIDMIQISLDAGSAESFEWLTGRNNYNRVCRNLETLVEIRNKRGANHLKITTHIIGVKELEHEFESFVARWNGIVDLVRVRSYGNWAGMVDENGVTPATIQNIPDDRYPCAWLWYSSKISANGDVLKCFVDDADAVHESIGNIMEQDFESIWRGATMRSLRTKHLSGKAADIRHCGTCMVWSLFPNFWDSDYFETVAN